MSSKTETILGVPIDLISEDEIINQLPVYIKEKKKMTLTSINPQILLVSEKNENVRNFLVNSTHRFPDGIGVVKISKWSKGNIKKRIAGIDIMTRVLEYADKENEVVYFYGASKKVLEQAVTNISKSYPGIVVGGYLDGYTKYSDQEMIKNINNSKAEILFVALGSPKQEEWLSKNMDQLNCHVFQTVGGSLDVFSGYVKRAPDFWIKLNLEWVYRSLSNPKRMYRILQIPQFVVRALHWNLKNNKQ
ncbi:MAG: WecB/TagA/CpsF family glycosyltransferase [Vagococcus sp.]|uniref:WecB/TagA/CpsF family glycosyltransferase n=1 Tax=Vagococcus sp. TaxID=1933889 RepID=UPI002FC8E73C